MINSLTIIFNAYFSDQSLNKVLKNLTKFKIIVIENSLQIKTKKQLETKYKNVKVIIPKKNLGLAAGYNLGIKKAKTRFVFLNNPDIKISHKSIIKLFNEAKKIKKFGIISPVYKNDKYFKNYKEVNNTNYKKNIISVNWIDNNFFLDKSQIKNNLFDENFFLFFETLDFCLKLKRNEKKLFVAKNIKFTHYGSQSVNDKYKDIVLLIRAWHYNWSKFYFYRKNYNYVYAFFKILPNIIQSLKNFIIDIFKFNFKNSKLHLIELYGILSAILLLKSFFRAKK